MILSYHQHTIAADKMQQKRRGTMKDAVIYARYSSDKQDEASIDAQVRA